MNFNIKLIISCLVLLACISFSNATQYLFSFTQSSDILMIDIGTGDLVLNQTMSERYIVTKVISVDYQKTQIQFMAEYLAIEFIGFVTVTYNWETNKFSEKSLPIKIGDIQFETFDQPYSIYNNHFYIPTYSTVNLSIADFDFNKHEYGLLTYDVPGWNSTLPALGTYSSIDNKYYMMYFNEETDLTATFLTLNMPIVEDNSGIQMYNLPPLNKGGAPFTIGSGELFVTSSGTLFFTERFATNITVYEINLTTLTATFKYCQKVEYSFATIEHFMSAENNYLVILSGPTYYNMTIPMTYTFVDTTTWSVSYSFDSPNYYIGISDEYDTNFYFDGTF